MMTQQLLPARLGLTAGGLVLAIASTVCLSTMAKADVLSHYQPKALVRAEKALEQGKPDLALRLLHQQRSIVRAGKHLARSESLTCRAYFQKGEYQAAEPACNTAVELCAWRWATKPRLRRTSAGRHCSIPLHGQQSVTCSWPSVSSASVGRVAAVVQSVWVYFAYGFR